MGGFIILFLGGGRHVIGFGCLRNIFTFSKKGETHLEGDEALIYSLQWIFSFFHRCCDPP